MLKALILQLSKYTRKAWTILVWEKMLEVVYFLLILFACVAIFFGLYKGIGALYTLVLTLVVAFVGVLFGYILFEKVLKK